MVFFIRNIQNMNYEKKRRREEIKSQRQEVDIGRESLVHAGKIVHKSSAKITMYIYIKFLL